MKTESILLFEEQSLEYRGWLVNIQKTCSVFKNKFSITLSIPESVLSSAASKKEQRSHKKEFEIVMPHKWTDLLGNNKRMFEGCIEEVKTHIDLNWGSVDSYLKNKI